MFSYVNLCVLYSGSVMKSINSIARTNKLIARCNTQKVRCACASDLPPAVLGRAPTPHFDPQYLCQLCSSLEISRALHQRLQAKHSRYYRIYHRSCALYRELSEMTSLLCNTRTRLHCLTE